MTHTVIYKISRLIVVAGVVMFIGAGTVFAHTNSQDSISLRLTNTPSATELGVPNPTFWNFLRIRVARAFTTSVNKKINLTDDLTTIRLIVAQSDPTNKLTEALKDFDNEKNQITTIKQKKPNLITKATKQNLAKSAVLQTLLLDTINDDNPSDTIVGQRDATISEAIGSLHELDKQAVNEVIDDVNALIDDSEDLPENEVAKKLALTEDLNDHENELESQTNEVDDNDDFDQAIAEQENEIEDDMALLPEDVLQKVSDIIAVSLQRHLIILEGVLAKVPESAKPALQKAIDEATKRMVEKLQEKDDLVEKMFEGVMVSNEVQSKIIERIKKEAEKENKSVEKALEKFKKQEEKQTEENKKQEEKRAEQQKKATEKATEKSKKDQERQAEKAKKAQERNSENSESESNSNNDSNTSTEPSQPGSSISGSSDSGNTGSGSIDSNSRSSNSGSTTEVEKQEIEIKAKDMAFDKTSYTVKKNAQITVKFKNEDNVAHSLVLNDYGLSTATTSKDGETTLVFTATKNTSFHCGIHSSMTGTITVL